MNSLRITPIQRIARYLLLFGELAKYTAEGSPDKAKFVHIHQAMIAQTEKLDSIRQEQETKRHLAVVNKQLKGKNVRGREHSILFPLPLTCPCLM